MPLHIEYRPKTLEEVIGNEAVKESIASIFSRKKDFPHAFLFHGATGCGKTTMARIVANMLDCPTDEINEYNTANLRGIDTIRNIMENCVYTPLTGSSRVYILDEVHRQTKDAQNALLKLLEDPPKNVYFILCTTDPEQLLTTIRGRCHTFQMKALRPTEMTELLNRVIKAEGLDIDEYPKTILKEISRLSEGLPRNALVLLDSIIDIADEESAIAALSSVSVSEVDLREICQALLNKSPWDSIRKQVKILTDETEPEKVRYAVLGYMRAVLLNSKQNNRASMIMDTFSENTYNGGKAIVTNMFYIVCQN
jgi:DNA polymerase-3 subunit gamma/tau